ncbi:ankyrin repeat-containing protein BDA1-like [Herrania umbratica]|uniref:Ankyrin repeat-containing protein BDA1-like n=1 Tax=Herrania umbratica TaxID=108875 RepID=A0A6J1BDL9_9ROSI|nr:ankyrin repeat-containing protein BDA1-like [Herrania umbratica]
MDNFLIEASEEEKINTLYELFKNDAGFLKRINETMFEDTPLHLAASDGETCFAVEVMNLMPSFARKLNKDGLSPMHLALLKGHSELVLLLLRADRDLVRVKGRGGMTPLHYATHNGSIDLLADFLEACPKSIEDMTVQGETVLHIAVKNNMLEALEVLVGWLKRVCHEDAFSWRTDILNWRDKQGDTVLDIAAIQLLYEINARNSKGKTALGTLQHQTKMDRRVVRQLLRKTRVSKPPSPKSTKTLAKYLRSKTTFDERLAVYITRQRMKIAEDLRNALLVVAGVIVAATFHAVFSPPGSFRKETANPTIMINGTYSTVTDASASGESPSNEAGKSVMDNGAFIVFSTFNTFVICSVIGILGLLLSDGLIGGNMMLMLIYLLVCYAVSLYVISPRLNIAVPDLLFLSLFIVFLYTILLIHSLGKRKLQQLNYDANKCPKEALADEVQESGARNASNDSSAKNITSA